MKKMTLMLAVILAGATLANGKSTRLVASWKNPEYSGPAFHRILVLGMSAKPGVRADFEDALSKLVARDGVEAIPGNTILLRPEATKLDLNYLKTQVKEFKIDAVIVSRLVKVDKNITYIPGQSYVMPYPYYRSFYGYYGAVYPVVYSPDYLREDQQFASKPMYTLLRHPTENWFGQASAILLIPAADKVIDGLSKLVVKELQKAAIL